MKTTRSKDGTSIAYDQLGAGPPLVLVDGAFCMRTFGPMPKLAPLLAERFTVIHYDRRGRGASGDTAPYRVEREIEDLQALFDTVGGEACLYGTSSGSMLAMRAVAGGLRARKLVVHEPPLRVDPGDLPRPPDFREQITAMVAADRRGDAVKLFMKVVGVPAIGIAFMRLIPGVWKNLKSVAHTLPYDFAILGDTQAGKGLPPELIGQLTAIRVPTLMLLGTKSPAWMQHAAHRVASAIPGSTTRLLPGQNHNAAAKAVAPVLKEFFAATP